MTTRLIQVTMLPAASVVIAEEDYRELERLHQENEQLRGNLSLAEEGLANYAQENAELRRCLDGGVDCAEERLRLRAALERIKAFPVGTFRSLADERAIWRIADDALKVCSPTPQEAKHEG